MNWDQKGSYACSDHPLPSARDLAEILREPDRRRITIVADPEGRPGRHARRLRPPPWPWSRTNPLGGG